MRKYLCATALGCVLSLCAMSADAHKHAKSESKQENAIIHASYSLPRQAGDDFRQTMREADDENKQAENQIAMDHADLYTILTSGNDFDRNAFLAKAKELRQLQEQTKENRDQAFVSAAYQLTPEERMTLAGALEKAGAMKTTAHHHKHMASRDKENVEEQNARSGDVSDDSSDTQQ